MYQSFLKTLIIIRVCEFIQQLCKYLNCTIRQALNQLNKCVSFSVVTRPVNCTHYISVSNISNHINSILEMSADECNCQQVGLIRDQNGSRLFQVQKQTQQFWYNIEFLVTSECLTFLPGYIYSYSTQGYKFSQLICLVAVLIAPICLLISFCLV